MLGVASPSFRAAYKIDAVAHIFDQDASSEQTTILMEAIEQQIKAFMTDEGIAAAEMLYGQVAILNTTFNKFMPIASISAGKDNFEKYFDTAMKAQEQARKTLQTLYDIKNSKLRTVFIKNAIAQQVNQLAIQTEKIQKQLETQPYVKDDFGSTQEAERLF